MSDRNDSLWLHRRQRKTWEFTFDAETNKFIHVTTKGTVYAIVNDLLTIKPFWVARCTEDCCRCEGSQDSRS